MKILLIEDERELSNNIVTYLASDHYLYEQAFTYREAIDKIDIYTYDCILLDLNLPGGDGLKILEEIKERNINSGVIIISARGSLDDKIKGLQIGADDYLAKPFPLPELSIRIYALLRRQQFSHNNTLVSNGVVINLLAKTVFVGETEIILTKSEYELLLFFVVIIIGLLSLQRILSRRLWMPFYNSLNEIENFKLEKGKVPDFEDTTTTEFVRLNNNLSKLMQDNITSYNQQKEFIDNASHELQTPLAVFQSQLDLLLQDSSLNEPQMDVTESLYDVSSRLSRLNKNLLLLSIIDNSQFKETITIDFSQLLEHQLIYFKELSFNNGITLAVDIQNPLMITANKVLLESLINNLISNAIRHNYNGGLINIEVKNNTFQISNSGDKSPLNRDKVFRRFSRTSEERKGNGLGLSIVNQICKLHGWEVGYNYNDDLHCFYVVF